jgi:hypothetical protein
MFVNVTLAAHFTQAIELITSQYSVAEVIKEMGD